MNRFVNARLEWDGKKPLYVSSSGRGMSPWEKTPARYGPFKRAFTNRFMFVYGTGGSEEENKACYDKARFDAQSWSYRGNGSVEIVADDSFQPGADSRSLVLYGNRNTNRAF